LANAAIAADTLPPMGKTVCDPYKKYSCLDSYLGDDFITRFINYYRLEWGHEAAPSDPKAPPSRRDGWPATPESTPPMPFTEWPYGGSTSLGVTRPSSIDSPLMAALGNTKLGEAMNDNHIQIYGWINAGGNLSNNTVRGGNSPAAYDYNPNTVQLDQAVVYIERLPDTVQKDHVDWGFRLAPIYGENYRYTTAFGLWSYQLLNQNKNYGYDVPMGLRRGVHSANRRRSDDPFRPLHLDPGHRGATRAEQLHVHALDDLYVRQLHQHGHPEHARGDQELDASIGGECRYRGDALACRGEDREPVPESALSEQHDVEGSGCATERQRRRPLYDRQRKRRRLHRCERHQQW
jgi:hypothetical protein